jgi:hypothetical protein
VTLRKDIAPTASSALSYSEYGLHTLELCSLFSEEIKPQEVKPSKAPKSAAITVSGTKEAAKASGEDVNQAEPSTDKPTSEEPKAKRPSAKVESVWRKGPPKAIHIPKDGLSAFAPPYSSKPVLIDNRGELQHAQLVRSPIPVIETSEVPKTESVWTRGPPSVVKTETAADVPTSTPDDESRAPAPVRTETQEVEIEPPTPSFSHLNVPASAWTVYSTDSDPAGPWDPAVRHQLPPVPPLPYSQHDFDTKHDPSGLGTYPWGMPMMPVPMMGYEVQAPQYPGGAGVLWTPNGWAVQDAAMKRALNVVEKAVKLGGKGKAKPRGVKSNFRSKSFCSSSIQMSDSVY